MNCLNYTEHFFLKILRAFVNGKMEEYDLTEVNESELYLLAKRHSLQGVVYYVSKTFGIFGMDSRLSEKLRESYEKTINLMALRRARAEVLSNELTELGISHIEFKGSAVADFYPVPELRPYSDVDMIIEVKDRDKVRELLVLRGFEYYTSDMGAVSCFKQGEEFYELHTTLNLPKSEAFLCDNFREKALPCCGKKLRFEDNFHLAYLISHMEKHMKNGGAGVKMYLDVMFYIKNCREIDLAAVNEILRKAQLEKFFSSVLSLLNRWFYLPIPDFAEPLDTAVCEELEELTLGGGVYGDHSQKRNLESSMARELKSGKKTAKLRFIMNRVFPKKTELWRMYPKYEDKPLLLPLAWFTHLVSFFKKGKYRKVRTVVSVDVKSAEKRNEFLESIGCK